MPFFTSSDQSLQGLVASTVYVYTIIPWKLEEELHKFKIDLYWGINPKIYSAYFC